MYQLICYARRQGTNKIFYIWRNQNDGHIIVSADWGSHLERKEYLDSEVKDLGYYPRNRCPQNFVHDGNYYIREDF